MREFKEMLLKVIPFDKRLPQFQQTQQAIEVLLSLGAKSADDLVDLLRDAETELELRCEIVSLLAWMDYKPAVPVFVQLAQDEKTDLSIRRATLVYLTILDTENAYQILSELALTHPHHDIQVIAVSLLHLTPSDHCINFLLQIVQNDSDTIVRAEAARGIGIMALPDKASALEPLLTVLNNQAEASIVRAYAADALGFKGGPRAVSAIIRFLADPSPDVRYMCAYSLGFLGDESHLPLLEALTTDDAIFENWGTVAEAAKEAIKEINSP